MRLAEILAAKLEQWADTTACYVQDSTLAAWPCVVVPTECVNGLWRTVTKLDFNFDAKVVFGDQLAHDADHAIVARWEWEAARAKLVQP